MPTECTPNALRFHAVGRRAVLARSDGGTLTTDGGAVLLREVERVTGILRGFTACFRDGRAPTRVRHSVAALVRQRVYGLALGYEDLNDHDQLRHDPLLAVLAETEELTAPLAGKRTVNRLELRAAAIGAPERYKKLAVEHAAVDQLCLDVFVAAHATPPAEVVLDLDATDDPIHGRQEGRFFHGFYGGYCYLPLYILCGAHLLCARLRTADRDPSDGALAEVERIVAHLRTVWPTVRIILRADSGFCRDGLLAWCEAQGVDYVIGLAKNRRLRALIADDLTAAEAESTATGRAVRRFVELTYRTPDSWTCARRVVAKAEHLPAGSTPRFVVTSIAPDRWPATALYERLYCARGDMENRIKEQQLMLFADRTSAATLRANQLRLCCASVAYLLLHALRCLALAGTALAHAQCHTLRLTLLKIGARVRVTTRKVWPALATGCPHAVFFTHAHTILTHRRA